MRTWIARYRWPYRRYLSLWENIRRLYWKSRGAVYLGRTFTADVDARTGETFQDCTFVNAQLRTRDYVDVRDCWFAGRGIDGWCIDVVGFVVTIQRNVVDLSDTGWEREGRA